MLLIVIRLLHYSSVAGVFYGRRFREGYRTIRKMQVGWAPLGKSSTERRMCPLDPHLASCLGKVKSGVCEDCGRVEPLIPHA